MKVIGLDNRTHNWPPSGCEVNFDDLRPRSELHLKCRSLLMKMYPTQPVLEEVSIPGSSMKFDFYLPFRKVAIECQGEQHYKYIQHFHGDRMSFARSKKRDKVKVTWCNNNNIRLVTLPYNKIDEWQQIIEDANEQY